MTPILKNPKILKLIVLVDLLYLKFGEKAQVPKLSQVEYKFLMYTVSKFQTPIHYILGDMIPLS